MFQKHRVEIITFVVAAIAALSIFAALEIRKPDGGLLVYLRGKQEIRHKETGEVLARGFSKRRAVLDYLAYVREVRGGIGPEFSQMPMDQNRPEGPGRRRGRLTGADLARINLAGADLAGLRLRDAWCEGGNFKETNLIEARMEGSQFIEADFQGAILSMADLEGADFTRANLQGIQANGTQFTGGNLTAANLAGADLSRANFKGANLAGVTFDNTTRFSSTQLAGALNVSDALRAHARTMGANLTADASQHVTP